MNLPKAIELNQESESSLRKHNFDLHAAAIKLGIEAIKECQRARKGDPSLDGELLPGED